MASWLFVLLSVVAQGTSLAAAPAPRHDIQLMLSVDTGEVRISDRVQVAQRHSYRFHLAPWLRFDEVKLNGAQVQVQGAGGDYHVDLSQPGDNELVFHLSGNLPSRASGADASAGMASVGADGVYLPGYDAWIPHDLAERLEYRLRVTLPSAQPAVATGKIVEESDDGEFYRATFEQSQPGEAPSLFAGPYQVRERVSDGLRLRTYFHEDLEAQAEIYLDAASTYIQRFQREIGEYPYAGFNVVSAPLPVGLGFPGATYIDRRIVPLPFMRTRSLAHEVVHNWWGNAVAVDYAGGNWAEGLTTYMADYGLERDKGEVAARNMRVKWLRDYAALPAARDKPVREFRSKQHQASQVIGYNKVAFIFHMLRREIGQQAFDEGIRLFWREHRFGTASWHHLQAAFEQSAARELGWFFRQWLDQAGAPRLSLGSHKVEMADGGYRTSIEVLQPVNGYQFGLVVSLTTEAGVEQRSLFIQDRLTRLEWTTAKRPLSIHFDPQNDLFRRLQTAETPPILRDITLNPASVVMIDGPGQAFADSGRLLGGRLMDAEAQFLQSDQLPEPGRPLLLITDFERLPAQLKRLQLRVPDDLPDIDHDAAAWTARLANNTPVLVVTAASNAALQALLRPLPHYGGQSYVLFDGGRAQQRGLWPISHGALYRDLTNAR
jgi:aminopeptidase N